MKAMTPDESYHTTVLLHEGVDALNVRRDGVYVDATLGAAGHAKLILSHLGDGGRLLGFDQDSDAVKNAPKDPRFIMCQANFQYLQKFLSAHKYVEVDGVLADLGVSGHHFDAPERGFSFRFDAPLDMRMNQSRSLTAAQLLETYEVQDLSRIFRRYGESSFSGKLARSIVARRSEQPLRTTFDLVRLMKAEIPPHKVKGELPRIFQAIRIEVNQELEVLKDFLAQTQESIKPGGRLVVLSYHSLEDRLVKHFLRSGNFEDRMEKDVFGNVIRPFDPYGKVIAPSAKEIENNPRARSAKMRIGVKR